MKPDFYWIDKLTKGGLIIMPRPRPNDWLEDELLEWKREGIDIIVSLLTTQEVFSLGLAEEEALCTKHGLEFHLFSVEDRQTPRSKVGVLKLVKYLSKALNDGQKIAVHCRMGIGRSSSMIACILVAQGLDVGEAFRRISVARGHKVPDNPEQFDWVSNLSRQLRELNITTQ